MKMRELQEQFSEPLAFIMPAACTRYRLQSRGVVRC